MGTVYTPDWIAKQMIYFLLDNHISKSINAFGLESVNFHALYIDGYLANESVDTIQASKLIEYLLPLKILDLSCGSGVLLLTYIEFFTFLLQYSDYNAPQCLEEMISHNIYGIDIDERAISGFKQILSELAKTFQFSLLSINLFCANSLIDILPLSSKKFDLVIGNPPYIGEKNNLEWFKPIKTTNFGMKYYEGKMDYFYFFIYKGYELLNSEGSLCYLSSNYFLTANGASKLRNFIRENFNICTFVDYGDKKVFPERKLHACAYVLQKKSTTKIDIYDDSIKLLKQIPSNQVYYSDGTFKFIISEDSKSIIDAMLVNMHSTLGSSYEIHQGIVSGSDKHFVYSKNEQEDLPLEVRQYLKPFYKNSDVGHFYVNEETDLDILYIDNATVNDALIRWMKPFEEKLNKRREVVKNIRNWYMLTWPREESIFNNEKIVVPQRARTNRFAYTSKPFYASADVYYITITERSPYSLPVLTLLLNASLYLHWLSHMGKRKGNLLELYATPLKEIPLPKLTEEIIIKLEQWGRELYQMNNRVDNARIEEIMSDVNKYLKDAFLIVK